MPSTAVDDLVSTSRHKSAKHKKDRHGKKYPLRFGYEAILPLLQSHKVACYFENRADSETVLELRLARKHMFQLGILRGWFVKKKHAALDDQELCELARVWFISTAEELLRKKRIRHGDLENTTETPTVVAKKPCYCTL